MANAPGEQIFPRELGCARELLAGGGDIAYVVSTDVQLSGPAASS